MFKAINKWLPGYLRSVLSRPRMPKGTRHLIFCVCDHFEPFRGEADAAVARQTVRDWVAAYPGGADSFRDADGHPPRHTFFYPQEEYDAAILDDLAAFCRKGYGEVEIHLHHRHDTPAGFREKLETFRDLLYERHGLLGEEYETTESVQENTPHPNPLPQGARGQKETPHPNPLPQGERENLLPLPSGERAGVRVSSSLPRYAFIHGNWALCNSRPDGDWCGVNEELGILAETGCYADFTFPSAPSPTQPRMVNAIYYAHDTPGHPRAADRGTRVKTADHRPQTTDRGRDGDATTPSPFRGEGWGEGAHNQENTPHLNPLPQGERKQRNNALPAFRSKVYGLKSMVSSSLLLITGPLALNWRRRKWGIFPRLENAEISGANPPTADRIRLWVRQHIHVRGRPEWVFVKVHTHGCVPANQAVLLGQAMRQAHAVLQQQYNDGNKWQLHYVTAREMANLVKAAEAGLPGAPGLYRDYQIGPPSFGCQVAELLSESPASPDQLLSCQVAGLLRENPAVSPISSLTTEPFDSAQGRQLNNFPVRGFLNNPTTQQPDNFSASRRGSGSKKS